MRRWLPHALAAAVVAGVFALYLHPTLQVALAEQIWACFN